MISGNVAPLARFIMAITSAFLLVRSALGLLDAFFVRPAFFAGLAFLPALREPFGFAVSGAGFPFSLSSAFSLIEFLLDRVAVVTVITPVRRNCKHNLRAIRCEANAAIRLRAIGGSRPFFIGATKSGEACHDGREEQVKQAISWSRWDRSPAD